MKYIFYKIVDMQYLRQNQFKTLISCNLLHINLSFEFSQAEICLKNYFNTNLFYIKTQNNLIFQTKFFDCKIKLIHGLISFQSRDVFRAYATIIFAKIVNNFSFSR